MHGFYETVARSTADIKKKEHTSNRTRIEEKQKENRKQKVHLLQHAATTGKILPVAQYMYSCTY